MAKRSTDNPQFINAYKNMRRLRYGLLGIKHYDFYGWAIAGPQKKQMKHILWRVLALIEDGKFDRDETWLHFLGVADLKTAVLLTKLRDVLRDKYSTCHIEVSFDTSTPFKIAGRAFSAYTLPVLGKGNLSMPMKSIDKPSWAGSKEAFPFQGSELAKNLSKGDIVRSGGEPDTLGYLMLQNHNIETQVVAIDAIHKVLAEDFSRSHLEQLVPRYLLEAQSAIEDVLGQPSVKKSREKLMECETLRVLDEAYKDYPRARKDNAAATMLPTQTDANVIDLRDYR